MRPLLYAYCDTTYLEKYGRALEKSAKVHGFNCLVECSGVAVNDGNLVHHSHHRYQRLPDLFAEHGPVMLLDVDSIIRKPFDIKDGYEFGIALRPENQDYMRAVNGGCVFVNHPALAAKLKQRVARSTHWFSDQISLFRTNKRAEYKTLIFGDDFFSWRLNPGASIWTGKGKAKFRKPFLDEVAKYQPRADV